MRSSLHMMTSGSIIRQMCLQMKVAQVPSLSVPHRVERHSMSSPPPPAAVAMTVESAL